MRRAVGVELVVVEAVLLVPQARAAERVHRVGDGDEVLEELRGDVLVARIVARQLQRHRRASSRSRTPSTRCRRPARGGRRWAAACERSKTPMLSSPRNPPAKRCLPFGVLAIDPPGEVEQQLLERARAGTADRAARARRSSCRRASTPRRAPAGSRRRTQTRTPGICPLGCMYHSRRNSTSCSLANSRIDARQREHVKRQVPRRVPRILPLVRHRDDVAIEQVRPVVVAAGLRALPAAAAAPGRRRASPSRRSDRTACSRAARRRPGGRSALLVGCDSADGMRSA